jgi:sulfite reductase (NADPH) hemoprotein beta-component
MQADAIFPVGTYGYQQVDLDFLNGRAAQFRDQVARRLSGDLSEDEFKPLRLMNGLYLQLHAYMLRVAIPYGVLSAAQLRRLARIARIYDRGYGHFTTRQNIQFNWIKLEEVPDILAQLAEVGMHAIQTSGNCIRNITSDEFAGAAADELIDPRVHAEILRQWSTLHPSFRSCRASSSSPSAAARMIALRRASTTLALSQSPMPTAPWASKYSPEAGSGGHRRSESDCVSGCRNTSC